MFKEAFRTPAGTADGSTALSGHTGVFPDSQGHLPADSELKLDVT